jgi:HNH endonuclease
MKLVDLSGTRAGRFTVVRRVFHKPHHTHWECRCDCGQVRVIDAWKLKRAADLSCGCARVRPVDERFWAKVKRGPGCWEWQGYRDRKGYGRIGGGKDSQLVHRLSWSLHHGDPGELCVLHHCDNPPCVNPDHLFLGTIQDNNADMIAKGRRRPDVRATHCKRGHEYTSENTYEYRGARHCIQCSRERTRALRAAGYTEKERSAARAKYWANIEESRRRGREKARKRYQRKKVAA